MSKLEVDKIDPQSGTALEIGTSGDTVTIPSGVTLDASNATTSLPATVVTTTGTQTLTNKSIATTQLTGTITPSDSTVSLAKLTATGTKDATTFLRGDNTFASAGGENTPAFKVLMTTGQSIPSSTATVVAFDTEIFDTDNAVSSGVFTVPSGKAGKYLFTVNGGITTNTDINEINLWLSKNSQTALNSTDGSAIGIGFTHALQKEINSVSGVFDLAVGDTVRVYIYQDLGSNKNTDVGGRFTFQGYKLIT